VLKSRYTLATRPATLPENLDLVNHLVHALQSGHGDLGKLLVIEARHLPVKKEAAIVEFAPNALHAQMGLPDQPGLGGGGRMLGAIRTWLAFQLRFSVTTRPQAGLAWGAILWFGFWRAQTASYYRNGNEMHNIGGGKPGDEDCMSQGAYRLTGD
jgi:hypothetical protein